MVTYYTKPTDCFNHSDFALITKCAHTVFSPVVVPVVGDVCVECDKEAANVPKQQ